MLFFPLIHFISTDAPLFTVQMGPYPSHPPTQAPYPSHPPTQPPYPSHPPTQAPYLGQSQLYPVSPAQPSYALPQPTQPPLYPAQQPSHYPAQPTSMPRGVHHSPPASHEMEDVTTRMGAASVQDSMPAYQVSDSYICICDQWYI